MCVLMPILGISRRCCCKRRKGGQYYTLLVDTVGMGNRPTPLRRAIRENKPDKVEQLLLNSPDPAYLINEDYAPDCIMDSCSRTIGNALYYAVARGRVDIVAILLRYGGDVYSTGHQGETCLHCAARVASMDIVRMLIDHGCDPSATDDLGRTVLHSAARSPYNTVKILNYLVQEKSRQNDVTARDFRGLTPLHECACYGTVPVGQFLIDSGADVNAVDKQGQTPLDLAKLVNHTCMITLLLSVPSQRSDVEINDAER